VHADGAVQPVGALGTLLGTDIEPQLTDVSLRLHGGDVLVLYTDGVTEVRRRQREVFGHRELTELLSTCGGLGPDAVADRIEQTVLSASEGQPRDDVAILALGPVPGGGRMMPDRTETEETDG
jgi:serine phosphatase RsbU (regulator of sigma subunit)